MRLEREKKGYIIQQVMSSNHLCVKYFSQLSFDSEMYAKSVLIHYLQIKVEVVNFTKARGLVKFQSTRALRALGLLQNLLLPLYFGGNVSLFKKV